VSDDVRNTVRFANRSARLDKQEWAPATLERLAALSAPWFVGHDSGWHRYSRLHNLREALKFMVLARFRGFAHLEKWFDDDGRVTHIESVSTDTRGINPFHTYLKALDEALVLAATGGKLSILSERGVGLQAGQVHWRAWREVMQAEALLISEVFQRQFDAPLLARHFPGRPPLAYFELCANEETDVGAVVEHAARLSAAGYTMDAAQLSEKTGYRLARAPGNGGMGS